MKKALMIAPAASVFRSFCKMNLEALKEQDYEIYLAANYSDSDEKKQKQYDEFKKQCENDGISTIDIKFSRKSLFKNFSAIKKLKKLIKEENFDLIHSHTETGGLILALINPKNCNKIYTPHGISFYKGSSILSWLVFYPIERWICGRMDKVLAINEEEFETVQKWRNCEIVFVHGIGVDTNAIASTSVNRDEIRASFGIEKEDFFVLCVGELNANKNHKTVISAIASSENKNIKCVICGVGGLKEEFLGLIEKEKLTQRVTLAGYRTDIPMLLNAADIFAFPSYHEGLPVSVMEAMSASLPIVCSKIRGNCDLIKDGEGGFLFAPDDIEGFKDAFDLLLKNVDKRSKMGKINRETVKKYDFEAVKKELLGVYA